MVFWFWRYKRALGFYLLLVGFMPLVDALAHSLPSKLGYTAFFWVAGGLLIWRNPRQGEPWERWHRFTLFAGVTARLMGDRLHLSRRREE